MIFGPVVLVTSSRRVRYFIVRVVYAAILLITLWTQYESSMIWRVSSGVAVTASVLSELAIEFFQSFTHFSPFLSQLGSLPISAQHGQASCHCCRFVAVSAVIASQKMI